VGIASAMAHIDWRRVYRRGFDAGALTLFLGPPVGGATFGVIAVINHFVPMVKGQLPGHPATFADQLSLVFLFPMIATVAAYFIRAAWLAAAVASLYVAVRVGATGRMTWAETACLALACSLLACLIYPNDFPSINALIFMISVLCAALVLRYLAGRWRLVS
jgi:hypothetical protein